ncbi:hypothetical protein BGX24_005379 [Mortierella sp. AD032]|nr:hypothetical protein BGX24_005379 [Mortierella sp. AD032]
MPFPQPVSSPSDPTATEQRKSVVESWKTLVASVSELYAKQQLTTDLFQHRFEELRGHHNQLTDMIAKLQEDVTTYIADVKLSHEDVRKQCRRISHSSRSLVYA